MNPDGTEQLAYYGSGGFWPNRIFYARPIPGHPTMFVGIVSGHHGTARAGELVLFDVAKGRRQAEGVVQRIPGKGRSVEAVMIDGLVDASWPRFIHPYPLSDKYFLVACQPTKKSRWGIYLADVFDNLVLLCEEKDAVLFEPVPVRRTPRPHVIPSRVDLASREATVYLSNVYAGEGLGGIPRAPSSGSACSPTISITSEPRASKTTLAWMALGTSAACWARCPWPRTARLTSACLRTLPLPCNPWTPSARRCN